jgi:CRP-like cAMP-binding protein
MTTAPIDLGIIELLAQRGMPVRRFEPGERIFLEDDEGDCMYVVRSGRVDVITFGNVLETVAPGGIFGEMALIDGGMRSAAALAAETTEAVVIDAAAFRTLIADQPDFALAVMQLLAERLRRMRPR